MVKDRRLRESFFSLLSGEGDGKSHCVTLANTVSWDCQFGGVTLGDLFWGVANPPESLQKGTHRFLSEGQILPNDMNAMHRNWTAALGGIGDGFGYIR